MCCVMTASERGRTRWRYGHRKRLLHRCSDHRSVADQLAGTINCGWSNCARLWDRAVTAGEGHQRFGSVTKKLTGLLGMFILSESGRHTTGQTTQMFLQQSMLSTYSARLSSDCSYTAGVRESRLWACVTRTGPPSVVHVGLCVTGAAARFQPPVLSRRPQSGAGRLAMLSIRLEHKRFRDSSKTTFRRPNIEPSSERCSSSAISTRDRAFRAIRRTRQRSLPQPKNLLGGDLIFEPLKRI